MANFVVTLLVRLYVPLSLSPLSPVQGIHQRPSLVSSCTYNVSTFVSPISGPGYTPKDPHLPTKCIIKFAYATRCNAAPVIASTCLFAFLIGLLLSTGFFFWLSTPKWHWSYCSFCTAVACFCLRVENRTHEIPFFGFIMFIAVFSTRGSCPSSLPRYIPSHMLAPWKRSCSKCYAMHWMSLHTSHMLAPWKHSCSKCYGMDCLGTYFTHAQT